jgi:regulator of sigma E protease
MSELLYGLSSVVCFLAIVTVLIVIHELGHYMVARCFRIRVAVVSLGLGRELAGRTSRDGTRWRISMIPVGGYVRLATMEAPGDALHLFHAMPLSVRAAFMAAGPMANFALAMLIFALVFVTTGQRMRQADIIEVIAGSPAAAAGIQPGDRFISVNGHRIQRFNEIEDAIHRHPGDTLVIVLQRAEARQTVTVVPALVPITGEDGRPDYDVRIGIKGWFTDRLVRFKPWLALGPAAAIVLDDADATVLTIRQLIEGKRPASQLRGNVAIAAAAQSAVAGGLSRAAWFAGSLSVGIGMFNLFPIPVLDGGNLLLYAIEAVRGRPLGHHVVAKATRFGFYALAMFVLFGLRNDMLHLMLPKVK